MIRYDSWQQEVKAHRGDLLLCTGRRIGKTQVLAEKGVDRMAEEPNLPMVVVSLTEDQAELIIIMALNYAREKYPKLIAKGRKRPTKKTFTLTNGSKMISRPVGTTGDSTRGFEGGILMVDEASRMPKLFWIAAKPILLTTGGELWLCSTPFGKQGFFWKSFNAAYNLKDPDARFKVFYKDTPTVMAERPICDTWTQKQRDGALRILELDKKEMSELEFGQEYLGLFLEDLRQFFDDFLISRAMTLERGKLTRVMPELQENYLGIDYAGVGDDENVMLSVERTRRDRISQVDMQITKKIRSNVTVETIKTLDRRYCYRRIYIDDGGAGVAIFDPLLANRQTRRKVVGINNASRSIEYATDRRKRLLKEDLYNNLLTLFEENKISLFNEPEIMLSLKSVQCEIKDGKMRIFGNYTHIAEALIRAAWCMKDKSLKLWCR